MFCMLRILRQYIAYIFFPVRNVRLCRFILSRHVLKHSLIILSHAKFIFTVKIAKKYGYESGTIRNYNTNAAARRVLKWRPIGCDSRSGRDRYIASVEKFERTIICNSRNRQIVECNRNLTRRRKHGRGYCE